VFKVCGVVSAAPFGNTEAGLMQIIVQLTSLETQDNYDSLIQIMK
jgi:hypothetical protein